MTNKTTKEFIRQIVKNVLNESFGRQPRNREFDYDSAIDYLKKHFYYCENYNSRQNLFLHLLKKSDPNVVIDLARDIYQIDGDKYYG